MPEEYRDNRAYVFCNDCNSRSIVKYHWLGLKCSICESYNTTQLELLGPEQTPQQIREQNERAQELGVGEAGLTASQSHTPSSELTSPFAEGTRHPRRSMAHVDRAQSPPSRGSPFLLPHSPTRSARSVTPVVGSYFGTSQRQEPERRGSYFSIFSAGQPTTPLSIENNRPPTSDEEMDFWGGHSPRSHDADMEVALPEASDESSSSDEEVMTEDEDEAESDGMELFGHR